MTIEFTHHHVETANRDDVGQKYVRLLAEADAFGLEGTTLDFGYGIHPSLITGGFVSRQRPLRHVMYDVQQHIDHIWRQAIDPVRKPVLLNSLYGLGLRLQQLSGEIVTPSQMARAAFKIKVPEEEYDDSWVDNFYAREVLPLIPERFFPHNQRTPEMLLLAYNKFRDKYRLQLLTRPGIAQVRQADDIRKLGIQAARMVFKQAQSKGVLIADSVDNAIEPVKFVPIVDSPGGEGGYFRFDKEGKPELTLHWRSKSESTPWDLLLTMSHELAGHYQEYSEKIKFAWSKGWTEWAVSGLYSPAAYLSEGVAQLMPRYLFPDPASLLQPTLELYELAGHDISESEYDYRDEILRLIKLHKLINDTPEVEFIEINTMMRFEKALNIRDPIKRERAIQEAKHYFQKMRLRTDDLADARKKFIIQYGGYNYLYPFSSQSYQTWFENQGQTAEALLKLMREPIVLGTN